MKELIPMNEFGISVLKKDNNVVISSRTVAEMFDKRHDHVLRDIEDLMVKIEEANNLAVEVDSPVLGTPNDTRGIGKFYKDSYINLQGKKQPQYLLDEDAFTLLTMGYKGVKAIKFKLLYVKHFNQMKEQLRTLMSCRLECRDLTDALQRLNSSCPFIYSNEFNMINKLVLGMSTKDFRALHNIKKGESIRPFLTDQQLNCIQHLQKYDSVLVDIVPEMNVRKTMLENHLKIYLDKLNEE